MIKDEKYYEKTDSHFYEKEIGPRLPEEILDFHVHLWERKHLKDDSSIEGGKGKTYMVFGEDYLFEDLEKNIGEMFPDKTLKAVCFGKPIKGVDSNEANKYISSVSKNSGILHPLMLAGRGLLSADKLESELIKGKFLGYKVFLNWTGDDYGNISVEDMISPAEMEIADKYNLIVLLHVPRSDRLEDPVVQGGVRDLSKKYPNTQIVLAHCGRCYLPDQMKRAVSSVKDLGNVHFDTAMVMDPTVLEILLDQVDSKRLLFATDLPIAAMRGRRIYVMDHWVDIVLEGNPESMYRVQSNNMRATFMVYEIVLAILRATERLKFKDKEIRSIFHDNGMDIINKVKVPGI